MSVRLKLRIHPYSAVSGHILRIIIYFGAPKNIDILYFNLFNAIYERTHKQLLKEETGSDLILLVQQLDAISLFIYCLNIVKFIKTIDISFFKYIKL